MNRDVLLVVVVLVTSVTCACGYRAREETGPTGAVEGGMADTTVQKAIVDLERTALEQFGRGEVDGPISLCDDSITYFDPFVERRIEDRKSLATLYEQVRGRQQYVRLDVIEPRVQVLGDTAVLSYVLATFGTPDTPPEGDRWKVTAVYHLFADGWRVVHAHFALFAGSTPRDFDFGSSPVDLGRIDDPLLGKLLGLEDAAMERWRRGDPWGFWELSASAVSYFDPETDGRLDGAEDLRALYAAAEGKILYDVSEYIDPVVQPFGDVAVLSYHYRSAETQDDGSVSSGTRWNTTEVFARIEGRWRIVHTHWSYARAGATE